MLPPLRARAPSSGYAATASGLLCAPAAHTTPNLWPTLLL